MSIDSIQAEQRRHQYLAAMGVASWLPRSALLGARASSDSVYTFLYGHEDDVFESVAVADEVSVASEAHINEPLHQPDRAAVRPAPLDLLAPSDKPVRPFREEIILPDTGHKISGSVLAAEKSSAAVDMLGVDIAPRTVKERAPRFRLGFWLFKDLLVVDSLPLLSRGGITQAKYQTLCVNMVKAMGLDAELLVAPYILAWPMLAGESLDQGKVEASLAVNHKVHKLLNQAAPRWLLFLGESAAQITMQREEGIDELRAVVFNYSSHIKAITSLSLTQMLQIPECKKEVWNDLQKALPIHV